MRAFILIFISLINLSAQNLKQSIETVISAFSEVKTDNHHLTPYLLEIAKNGQNLGYDDKNKLKEIGFNFNHQLVSRGGAKRSESAGLDKFVDSEHFRFHYTTSGYHAIDSKDQDNNSLPDYLESVIDIFDYVSKILHDQMGYTKPPGDGYYSTTRDKGGS